MIAKKKGAARRPFLYSQNPGAGQKIVFAGFIFKLFFLAFSPFGFFFPSLFRSFLRLKLSILLLHTVIKSTQISSFFRGEPLHQSKAKLIGIRKFDEAFLATGVTSAVDLMLIFQGQGRSGEVDIGIFVPSMQGSGIILL